jgi:AcrR family transcriptional regulator
MSVRPRRRVGRPSVAVLNRDLIAEAGLRLLDEGGTDGFTMACVADLLQVRPSALYNHVAGKDDVVAGIRELISDRIDVSGFETLPWDDALEQWAHSYRNAFAAHPPTIAMLATMPLHAAQRTMRMYEIVVEALSSAGWPGPEVLPTIVALESFILGSALDATAPGDMFDPRETAATVPHFAAAYRERLAAIGDEPPADGAFAVGLHAMIVGLRARHAMLTVEPGS